MKVRALKLPPILDAISSFDLKKPIIFAGLDEGARINSDYVVRLRELHVPFFPTAERAFRALARLSAARRDLSGASKVPAVTTSSLPHGVLTEYQSKKILKSEGFPVLAGELARSLDEAMAIAGRIGFPVVLKAQSATLPHKTEAGGLVLNLQDREELASGWERLQDKLAQSRPDLSLDGVLVERMGEGGVECIVGARNDPEWGPTVVVGLGGIFAEALHDVRLLVPGLTIERITPELGRLKGATLLSSFRGEPAPDICALAELVQRLGDFTLAHPEVAEIDLNPVVAHSKGVTVLDALIVVSVPEPGRSNGKN